MQRLHIKSNYLWFPLFITLILMLTAAMVIYAVEDDKSIPDREQLQVLQNQLAEMTNHLDNPANLLENYSNWSAELFNIRLSHWTDSVGVEWLAESVNEFNHLLHMTQYDQAKAKWSIWRLLIAVDALSHRHQPMWLTSAEQLMQTAMELNQFAENAEHEFIRSKWHTFRKQYAFIQPAAYMNIERRDQVYALEALLNYLDRQWGDAENGVIEPAQWQTLQAYVQNLVDSERETTALPHVKQRALHAIILLSTLIGLALSYTVWRMYRYELNQKHQRRKQYERED